MKRVAIVGAGPSGLAQLRAFQAAEEKGESTPEIVCFEKQEDWGGQWHYSWRSGMDEYGEAVNSSMYRYLWSNGPKEGLEFSDYSFETHFGKNIASYPPREVLWDYIVGRVKKACVRDKIRFRTPVRRVEYHQDTGKFRVVVHDLVKDKEYEEQFDDVIVASGHFSTPNSPYFKGFEKFGGRILHAHDFKDALEFENKDILIVGSSYSAEDIGSQCWKYGCKSITVSYRTSPMGFDWPENWTEVPLITHVDQRNAYFSDGSSKPIDAIILCTGYLHHFPFLEEKLKLRTANRLAVKNLYKGVVWADNPKCFFLGMQDQWFTFNMFDAQAWYVRDIILGKIAIPSRSEMITDADQRIAGENALRDDYGAIDYQGEYVKELMALTDYPDFDVDAAKQAFYEWKKHKKQGIMTFRDQGYRSPLTGSLAPNHHTPWVDALDDSMASYLSSKPLGDKVRA